jgi:hypothetical protein
MSVAIEFDVNRDFLKADGLIEQCRVVVDRQRHGTENAETLFRQDLFSFVRTG